MPSAMASAFEIYLGIIRLTPLWTISRPTITEELMDLAVEMVGPATLWLVAEAISIQQTLAPILRLLETQKPKMRELDR